VKFLRRGDGFVGSGPTDAFIAAMCQSGRLLSSGNGSHTESKGSICRAGATKYRHGRFRVAGDSWQAGASEAGEATIGGDGRSDSFRRGRNIRGQNWRARVLSDVKGEDGKAGARVGGTNLKSLPGALVVAAGDGRRKRVKKACARGDSLVRNDRQIGVRCRVAARV